MVRMAAPCMNGQGRRQEESMFSVRHTEAARQTSRYRLTEQRVQRLSTPVAAGFFAHTRRLDSIPMAASALSVTPLHAYRRSSSRSLQPRATSSKPASVTWTHLSMCKDPWSAPTVALTMTLILT